VPGKPSEAKALPFCCETLPFDLVSGYSLRIAAAHLPLTVDRDLSAS
jgi:hypothetical protein